MRVFWVCTASTAISPEATLVLTVVETAVPKVFVPPVFATGVLWSTPLKAPTHTSHRLNSEAVPTALNVPAVGLASVQIWTPQTFSLSCSLASASVSLVFQVTALTSFVSREPLTQTSAELVSDGKVNDSVLVREKLVCPLVPESYATATASYPFPQHRLNR